MTSYACQTTLGHGQRTVSLYEAIYFATLSEGVFNIRIGWDFLMTFLPYGELWRDSRRLFHQHFTANVVPRYHPRIVKGTRRLLLRLLATPDDFMAHIRL